MSQISYEPDLFHISFPQQKMQSSLSLSLSRPSILPKSTLHPSNYALSFSPSTPINLQFCGLRKEHFRSTSLSHSATQLSHHSRARSRSVVSASASDNGTPPKSFDYDLIIIGAGVGGHGAALHAVEKVAANPLCFYPMRRSWSEGCLAQAAASSCTSSPSSSPLEIRRSGGGGGGSQLGFCEEEVDGFSNILLISPSKV